MTNAEQDNDVFVSAGYALVDATVDLLCRSSTLFTHTDYVAHQDPQVPFQTAALQSVLSFRIMYFRCKTLHITFLGTEGRLILIIYIASYVT